jgi:hypothetical protein
VKQEMTKALADGAATLAVSGGIVTKLGWFEFINANAQGLGFLASCVFGIIATVFYFLTYAKSTQSDKNKKDLKALEDVMSDHIKDTDQSFRKVDNGINEILKKLNNKPTKVN